MKLFDYISSGKFIVPFMTIAFAVLIIIQVMKWVGNHNLEMQEYNYDHSCRVDSMQRQLIRIETGIELVEHKIVAEQITGIHRAALNNALAVYREFRENEREMYKCGQ